MSTKAWAQQINKAIQQGGIDSAQSVAPPQSLQPEVTHKMASPWQGMAQPTQAPAKQQFSPEVIQKIYQELLQTNPDMAEKLLNMYPDQLR